MEDRNDINSLTGKGIGDIQGAIIVAFTRGVGRGECCNGFIFSRYGRGSGFKGNGGVSISAIFGTFGFQ